MATALLVIDMQRFFAPMVTESTTNALKLVSHFRSTSPAGRLHATRPSAVRSSSELAESAGQEMGH